MPVDVMERSVTVTSHDGILDVRLPQDGGESGMTIRVPVTRT